MGLPANPPEFVTPSAPDEARWTHPHRARLSLFGLVNRSVFVEVATAAALGISLFTLVLFFQRVGSGLFSLLVRASARLVENWGVFERAPALDDGAHAHEARVRHWIEGTQA